MSLCFFRTLLDEMDKVDSHTSKEILDIIVEIWKQALHKTVKETSAKSLTRAWFYIFFLIYWKISKSIEAIQTSFKMHSNAYFKY